LSASVLSFLACTGAAPPPPPTPPPAEPEDDGGGEAAGPEEVECNKDCVQAQATCDGGVCNAEVKNGCKEPVTCELLILALCEGDTQSGEAQGKSRVTIPAGESDKMQAVADCEGHGVKATTPQSLNCR
jgi:hypothetical protein